ncbi:hypothetical protein JOF53_000669 [Crossiella equi]|uniref:Uncharacterized protein n=1 Tax=Crossiella equi TaxID=130796 RepID=A0ABS5A6E1_9PSEU|nr:hypothetical protein [Crossiella equi]MBP2471797.1 hypothetical protein [Crossiella equi]
MRLWRAFDQAAASDELIRAELDALVVRMRAETQRAVRTLAERGALRTERDHDEIADRLWHIALCDHHHRLCTQMGWSQESYASWLAEEMAAIMLPRADADRVQDSTIDLPPPTHSMAAWT